MSEEYTPTTDVARIHYSGNAIRTCAVTCDSANTEFDRWLASHDLELREQIAQEIEGDSRWLRAALENEMDDHSEGFSDGLQVAAKIARGQK